MLYHSHIEFLNIFHLSGIETPPSGGYRKLKIISSIFHLVLKKIVPSHTMYSFRETAACTAYWDTLYSAFFENTGAICYCKLKAEVMRILSR